MWLSCIVNLCGQGFYIKQTRVLQIVTNQLIVGIRFIGLMRSLYIKHNTYIWVLRGKACSQEGHQNMCYDKIVKVLKAYQPL